MQTIEETIKDINGGRNFKYYSEIYKKYILNKYKKVIKVDIITASHYGGFSNPSVHINCNLHTKTKCKSFLEQIMITDLYNFIILVQFHKMVDKFFILIFLYID